MKYPTSGLSGMESPSLKTTLFLRSLSAMKTQLSCCAHTDSTSRLMRLNSSKQPQNPACASPLNMRPIIWWSI